MFDINLFCIEDFFQKWINCLERFQTMVFILLKADMYFGVIQRFCNDLATEFSKTPTIITRFYHRIWKGEVLEELFIFLVGIISWFRENLCSSCPFCWPSPILLAEPRKVNNKIWLYPVNLFLNQSKWMSSGILPNILWMLRWTPRKESFSRVYLSRVLSSEARKFEVMGVRGVFEMAKYK